MTKYKHEMTRKIMPSPYPLHYTLRWPIYYNWPSMRNHTKISRAPDRYDFLPHQSNTLKLLFCGDIMVQNQDRIPHLSPELCQLIQSSDLFIGNCEAPLGDHPQNHDAHYRFIFHMPRIYIENIIQQTGLPATQWILSTANNHSGDVDFAAYVKTQNILSELGVTPLGRYQQNQLPLTIIEKKGLRIGFVAWAHWMNREIFSDDDPGAFRTSHVIDHDWRKIKNQYQLNYLFAIPHWEFEFQHFPHRTSRELAKKLIEDRGIDFIVGIHTHTLQPMEWFDRGFCVYNLGNFCGLGKAWSIKLITLLEVHLELSSSKIKSYRLHYFFQQHDNQNQVTIIPLARAPEREYLRLTRRLNKIYDTNTASIHR